VRCGRCARRRRPYRLCTTAPTQLYETLAVPGSGVPVFQAASANLNPWTEAKVKSKNPDRGPLLIVDGEKDHTVPWAIARAVQEAGAQRRSNRDRQDRRSRPRSRSTTAGTRSPRRRSTSSSGSRKRSLRGDDVLRRRATPRRSCVGDARVHADRSIGEPHPNRSQRAHAITAALHSQHSHRSGQSERL
jgi:hypothetical protein